MQPSRVPYVFVSVQVYVEYTSTHMYNVRCDICMRICNGLGWIGDLLVFLFFFCVQRRKSIFLPLYKPPRFLVFLAFLGQKWG